MSIAASYKREFDASFAHAADRAPASFVPMLAIRVGGEPHAIYMKDVASLHADLNLAVVPNTAGAFLGLVGLRGTLVPVFDLGTLLGYGREANPRWVVVLSNPEPVAVAFQLF